MGAHYFLLSTSQLFYCIVFDSPIRSTSFRDRVPVDLLDQWQYNSGSSGRCPIPKTEPLGPCGVHSDLQVFRPWAARRDSACLPKASNSTASFRVRFQLFTAKNDETNVSLAFRTVRATAGRSQASTREQGIRRKSVLISTDHVIPTLQARSLVFALGSQSYMHGRRQPAFAAQLWAALGHEKYILNKVLEVLSLLTQTYIGCFLDVLVRLVLPCCRSEPSLETRCERTAEASGRMHLKERKREREREMPRRLHVSPRKPLSFLEDRVVGVKNSLSSDVISIIRRMYSS